MRRFAARNHVPALLEVHQLDEWIVVGHATPVLASLPVAEKHLTQISFDRRLLAELSQ
jgi:hypothetical protein